MWLCFIIFCEVKYDNIFNDFRYEYFYSVIILEVWLTYGNLGVGWKIGFVSFERSLLIEFIFNS